MTSDENKPARKATLRQIGKELGLSPDDITRAKRDGLNPYDRESMRKWKADRNGYARSDVPAELPTEDQPRLTLEQIEDFASRAGQSKKEIDVYKGQLEVMKAADALRVQRNKLLSREECQENQAKTAHALNAMYRSFETEIPAACYGKALGEAKQLVREKIRELQKFLTDAQHEFWKEHPES